MEMRKKDASPRDIISTYNGGPAKMRKCLAGLYFHKNAEQFIFASIKAKISVFYYMSLSIKLF